MKKTIKRIALTITILLALIGATGTVALASGYITWGGTADFEQTLVNLNLISERGRELKASNENINRELEQTHNQINALEQEIETLEKRVDGNKTTQDQLKQAEKDMRDVKSKSEEVLNEFN